MEERRQRPRPKLWRHAQTLSGAATGEAEGSSLRKRQRGALSFGPAPAQPFDASPPRAAIAEAEGLQLHLSSSSSSFNWGGDKAELEALRLPTGVEAAKRLTDPVSPPRAQWFEREGPSSDPVEMRRRIDDDRGGSAASGLGFGRYLSS